MTEPPRDCTPEALLAWLRTLGRWPTLQECRDRWGGILGPLMAVHDLKAAGRLPKFDGGKR